MSYSVDVNVLLYATDASSELHDGAAKFLAEKAEDPELLCLTWPTLMGYLRIATHPRIFSAPLGVPQALSNVKALLDLPQSRAIGEAEDFLLAYEEVTQGIPVRGNLVPDAHVASILRQHDVRTIYTNDADFRKFPFLTVINPFA